VLTWSVLTILFSNYEENNKYNGLMITTAVVPSRVESRTRILNNYCLPLTAI